MSSTTESSEGHSLKDIFDHIVENTGSLAKHVFVTLGDDEETYCSSESLKEDVLAIYQKFGDFEKRNCEEIKKKENQNFKAGSKFDGKKFVYIKEVFVGDNMEIVYNIYKNPEEKKKEVLCYVMLENGAMVGAQTTENEGFNAVSKVFETLGWFK